LRFSLNLIVVATGLSQGRLPVDTAAYCSSDYRGRPLILVNTEVLQRSSFQLLPPKIIKRLLPDRTLQRRWSGSMDARKSRRFASCLDVFSCSLITAETAPQMGSKFFKNLNESSILFWGWPPLHD